MDTIEHIPEHKNRIVLGDFNAGLHARKTGERNIFGPHIFGRGAVYVSRKTIQSTILNRDLLAEIRITHKLKAMNTFFHKPAEKLISHRPLGIQHTPPRTPERFATTDPLICRHR